MPAIFFIMEKQEIRKKIKALKSMLLETEKIESANSVFRILEQSAAFVLANRVLMYHSLPDELSTKEFLRKWGRRKQFFLPRVNGVNLEILPYDESRLELGAFHIEEPTGNNLANPEDIELIIVPAVAYDKKGNRLGRGKGFYDRLLKSTKATTIGVAYEFQIVEEIPVEHHDIPMDMIISPSGYVYIKGSR